MTPTDKQLVLLHVGIKSPPFTHEARREAGEMLRRLQKGQSLRLPHSRPMPSIGARCHELRILDKDVTWRIIYRIDHDAIVVADVFPKKTAATPLHVITVCKQRFRTYDKL